MKTREFQYQLPEHLIAQKPCDIRSESRMLHYSRKLKKIEHLRFNEIADLINPDDLLVFNNTRVIPARMFGHKASGGKVEVMVERVTGAYTCVAHVKASKTPKPGSRIILPCEHNSRDFELTVEGREGDLFKLSTDQEHAITDIMESIGHMPLPPYINREDTQDDHSRYQTVYASAPGAVAAPTAGLHFDDDLLETIRNKGVDTAFVTLHVGAGTFQPVRSELIEDHHMHFEYLEIPQETVDKCLQTRKNGGRIIAVGTTTVRSLESASQGGELAAFKGETDIFIYPGYEFKSVDALVTNFHLPESTLLMLISAFAGKDEVMRCYEEAVTQGYRFFSYGDAMFIS